MVGHDDEAVELEAAFAAMLEERCEEELCICCSLEMSMPLEGQDRYGVGALLLANCGHEKKAHPRG